MRRARVAPAPAWQSPGVARAPLGPGAGEAGVRLGSTSRYGGWAQPSDPGEEALEQLAGDRHLRDLEDQVSAVRHDLRPDLGHLGNAG